MKRLAVRLAKVFGIIIAVFSVTVLALQLMLNSAWMRGKLDGALSSMLENGELRYSRLHIKTFPSVAVDLDSLSLTYPHGLFSAYDGAGLRGPLLSEGRGAVEDTLFAADHIGARVRPWALLRGRISVKNVDLRHPRLFLHSYDSTASNLDIFRKSEASVDTVSKPFALPWISLGGLSVSRNPKFVYTSQADTLHARLCFDDMRLKGKVRLPKNKLATKVRGLEFSLDSLRMNGRLPADTVAVSVNHLLARTPHTNEVELSLDGDALYWMSSLGLLRIPADLQARAAFRKAAESFDVKLHALDADIAYIPLHAEGLYRLFDDHGFVKGSASIKDCDLGNAFDQYARNFFDEARNIRTDAHLNLEVEAEGDVSSGKWPAVEASLSVPSGHVSYLPRRIRALLDLAASAKLTPDKHLSASVERLDLSSDGLSVKLDGDALDLLGKDPRIAARADAWALLDSLHKYLPEVLDIRGRGKLDLSANVNAWLREFSDYQFGRSRLDAALSGDRIALSMPSQHLDAFLLSPDIRLSNGSSSMLVNALADSISVQMGDSLHAVIKDMVNRADVHKKDVDGKMVPYVSLNSTEDRIRIRSGENRVGLRGTDISLEAWQRVRKNRHPHSRRLDSLRRLYPGASRDSLFSILRSRRPIDEFASKDIRVTLDSSLLALYTRWHPGGLVSVDRVWLRSPSLPLRTRVNSVDIALDDDDAQIASFDLNCGTSDVSITGSAGGIRRFLRGRGALRFDLNLHSGRLNANEILVAMQKASENGPVSTETEDYVRDDLADATFVPDSTMRAFVVPKNLDGSINLVADRVDYSDFDIRPASAEINIRDRVLQLKDVDVSTNLGRIKLDAFYASHSKADIAAGLDMHLSDMSAYDIIHTIPSVNTMMPALKSFEGKLGCDVSLTTQLDTNMNILTPTVNGIVRVAGENLHISNAGSLRKITRLLMFKDKNIGDIDDLYVDAVIEDNKVEVYPFELNVDRYKVALMGTQGFNGSMKYNISVLKSIIPFRFGINIYGNLDKWRFSLGRNKYRNGKVPSFTADLDTVQVNILDVIRNIYDKGVENAMEQMEREQKRLANAKLMGGYVHDSGEIMTKEEFEEVDAALLEMELKEEMSGIESDITAVADEALDALSLEQMKWAEEHPWAGLAESRAQKRRAAKDAKQK